MINCNTVHIAAWPGANARFCFLFIALLGWVNSPGQDTTVNFWGGVTPKQTVASDVEIEQTLEVIRNIPFPDTTFYSCPALPDFGDINTTTSLEKYLGLTMQLQRQGRPDCVLEICERLLRKVPASKHELIARLLAEEVAVLVRFGDFDKAANPAKQLISLVEKGEISDPATLLTTTQYLHLKADASDRALAMAQRILDNARAKQDTYWEMRSLSLMGGITRDVYFGASLRAIPYHREALKIAEARQDTAAIIGEWMAQAMNYGDAGEQSRYLEYMRNALAYLAGYPDVRRVISAWVAISSQLNNVERLEESKTYLWKIRGVSQALHLTELARDADNRLFSCNMALEKYDEAEAALLRASDHITDGSKHAEQFYQLAKATNQPDKALFYLEKAYSEVSTKYVGRNATELSRMETQYNTRETTRTLREKEALLATTSRQRFLLLIFSALITLLLGVAIWTYVREIKVRKVLANQNKIIELQAVELRNLDKLKSHFFANVSHELRTPLTLMVAPLTSMLKREYWKGNDLMLLQMMQRNGNLLLKLVNEILDLSKLETGRVEVHETPVLLFEFMRPFVAQFSSFGDSVRVKFHYDYRADRELVVLLDKDKVEKIINNFLSNALKFSPMGSTVDLMVEAHGQDLLIKVKDCGTGIHPNDLPYIFDRFYQSKQPDAVIQGGTGIGLSLCKELAELLQGKVWVESEYGAGSTFLFQFPMIKADKASLPEQGISDDAEQANIPVPAILAKPTGTNTNPSILIVEDNADLRLFMRSFLGDQYQIYEAVNGKDGFDLLQSGLTPDLIISDVMMPVMDGIRMLELVKSNDHLRHIPFIILTARSDIKVKLRSLKLGVDDYLVKPFNEEELLARIENLLQFASGRPKQKTSKPAAGAIQTGKQAPPDLPENSPVMITAEDAEWLSQLELATNKHLQHFNFNADFLAAKMNLSARHLQRQIKRTTGLTTNHYIQEARLQQARELLESGKVLVKQVAAQVGFKDIKHFTGLYKNRFGKLPSEA
jgi:signal transduction histidine kinase/DNA-binding response OmpR family regulator